MAETEASQRIAAILAADAAGYTRLMAADEGATIAALDGARAIFREHIEAARGRIVDTAGDSVLAVFETTIGAVRAACAIQVRLEEVNAGQPEERRMRFRVGIHLGDIHEKADGSVYGDGVNIAARLQALAEPGGIVVSDTVQSTLRGRGNVNFEFLGAQDMKNVAEPVRAFRVLPDGETSRMADGGRYARPLVLAVVVSIAAITFFTILGVFLWQRQQAADSSPADRAADPVLSMPTGPSIAVFPLDNLSGDPHQDYFSAGITEGIITDLSKFRELLVFARNTTERYKAEGASVQELARDLGVRYVVDGSIQKAGKRIRVSVRLLDAQDGAQLWAESYDRELSAAALFDVQDDIQAKVVGTIAGSYGIISRTALAQAAQYPTEDLTAYRCVLEAYEYERVFTPEAHASARDCLEEAVKSDPDYADAWAKLAFVYTDEFAWGFNPRPDSLERAMAAARKALALDPTSQITHWHMARTHFWRGERDAFIAETEKAVSLNPNNSFVLAAAGAYYANAGEQARGAALARKAMAINPLYPSWYHFPIYQHLFKERRYQEALVEARKIDMSGYFWSHAAVAAVAGQLGRTNEAKVAVDGLRRTYPGFTLKTAEYELGKGVKSPEDEGFRARFIDGLRKAGLPDS